jgi:CHAD domain-containing protein
MLHPYQPVRSFVDRQCARPTSSGRTPAVGNGIAPGEHVGDSVRRLAHDRLQPAVEALELSAGDDLDEIVYDVRKRCRRVRALLRLVRADVGDEVYRRENGALRAAARVLSAVRDTAVLVEVHDGVVATGGISPKGFRDRLVEHHEDLKAELLAGDELPRVRESLAAVLERTEAWPITSDAWDGLGAGVERVYRRGRKAMAAAYDDPGTERFHEWRKRVKYLRHQMEYLEGLWPEVIGAGVESAQVLTGILGEAHDLAVLRDALVDAGVDREREAHLLELIDSRRQFLRSRARPIGQRLYAEKPSEFVTRLRCYWEAAATPATVA